MIMMSSEKTVLLTTDIAKTIVFIKSNCGKVLMDQLDRRILRAMQYDFPLSENPYKTIADNLHITRDQLWQRLNRLLDAGLIRRIGASIDSRKFGFHSTLAAVKIETGLIDHAAEIIGRFPEITHSYLRKDAFNIWFTIIAADKQRIDSILEQIRLALSLENSQILNLPSVATFKLNARFNVPL